MLYLKSCCTCMLLMLCLLCVNRQTGFAQSITGRVFRAGTDSAIAGASVYYGGSMAGTSTGKDGRFEIPAKQQQIPVTVSSIGYYSATLNYEPGKALIVYLKPKIEELHTVTVRADGMYREQEEAMFIRDFLGTSAYAKSCIITNLNDVDLFFDIKTQTLTASCDKPLIIANKKLGYLLTYYLDKFEDNADHLLIEGNHIFKDMEMDVAALAKAKRNRESVYEGSRMQFVRALWHHTLSQSGFVIHSRRGFTGLTADSVLITDSLQQKYIRYDAGIFIDHYNSSSFLKPPIKASFIDKNGFYNADLGWGGDIGNKRIGDMLPLEYRSEKEDKEWAKLPPEVVKSPLPTIPVVATAPVAIAEKPVINKILLFEKAYLNTDRDVYSRGDTLWFKAYLTDAQSGKLSASSNNLAVELISPDAKIISTELIRLENGTGIGDISLPDSIPAGKYHLRAYTNWMRNFGDNFVFEKQITVLSTGAVAVAPTVKKVAKTTKKATIATATATTLPLITFYPEGGSLVEGLTSMVAVKADDGFGRGIPATGAVVSSGGDTVARFSCDTVGMGLFALVPLKGQNYHTVVDFVKPAGRGQVFQVPPALSAGLALQVKQTDSLLRITVGTSGDIAALVAKPLYHIAIKHNGVSIINQQLQLSSQQTSVRIATASLPAGINAITLYDADNKPNSERLIYIHHQDKNLLAITTDKKTYQPKEQVTLQVNAPANTNLSMAVVDAGVVPEQADDIVSYLMLQSELKGNIEHARRYFDTTNVSRFKQLDLLLLTQGWRDFVWRRLADTAIRISYATEKGIDVPGLVKDEVNQKPLPNLNVTMYADAAKGTKIFSSHTDLSGRFSFSGLVMYGTQNVKLASVNDKGDKKGTFDVDTVMPLPVKHPVLKVAAKETPEDSLARVAIEQRETDIKKINLNKVTHLKEVTIKDKKATSVLLQNGDAWMPFGPVQSFNIKGSDIEYKTLLWYSLQHFKGVKQSSAADILFVGDIITDKPVRHVLAALMPPTLFVNGREIVYESRESYFLMAINKFKKIELQKAARGLTDHYLLYLTMNDDYLTDNPGTLSTDVEGYYQARIFYQPTPGAQTSLADFRTTIQWEPNITTDSTGKAEVKFYNAMPTGDVRVIVQGVTDSGVPVSSVLSYKVQ